MSGTETKRGRFQRTTETLVAGTSHPLLVAAAVAALCEGAATADGAQSKGATAVEAGALASSVVALPLLALGFAVAFLWTRRGVRKVVERAMGDRMGVFAMIALSVAACAGDLVGVRLVRRWSPSFAVIGTVGATLAALVGAVLVLLALGAALAERREGPRVPAAMARLLEARLLSGAALLGVAGLLAARAPAGYRVAPCAGLACLFAATTFPSLLRRAAPVLAVGVSLLALATASSSWLVAKASGGVRSALFAASPLAATTITLIRDFVDRDHDGFSPMYLGGDCDDHDPNVNQGAVDVPGNGIDEDCSGRDAPVFQPTRQPPSTRTAHAPWNVVIVLVDALRPDHLGFAGYSRPTSPEIDRFRSTATWFTHTYTPGPSTRYALSAAFTGLDVELAPHVRDPREYRLLPEAATFAERLQARGYDTVGFSVSWVVEHAQGMGQGFRKWETPWPDGDWERIEGEGLHAPLTTQAAIGYLSTTPDEPTAPPYLLFAHYQCTHWPYVPHSEWNFGSDLVGKYDNALAFCDKEIGTLLRAVEARTDYLRTAIVLLSDHGEMLGEHGFSAVHGDNLYEPDVRSVLLVHTPGGPQVEAIDVPVTLQDLAPTLASMANADRVGADDAWDLLPLLREDRTADPSRPLFLFADSTRGFVRSQLRGVLLGRYKYVRNLEDQSSFLYDTEADPAEATDLSASRPRLRDDLAALLEGHGAWISRERARATARPGIVARR